MKYFLIALFVVYIFVTWRSLQQAAAPAVPCDDEDDDDRRCFSPLTVSGDTVTMQLWFFLRHPDGNSDASWTPVEACRWTNVSLPATATSLSFLLSSATKTTTTDRTQSYHCTVILPDEARRRVPANNDDARSRQIKPLVARFVFEFHNQVVAMSPLELTRIVEKRINDNSSQQERVWKIPHLKYHSGKAPIRLRFVDERRRYGGLLVRADGLRYKTWNATHYAPYLRVDDLSLPKTAQRELAPPRRLEEDDDVSSRPVTLHIQLTSISPVVDTLNQQLTQALHMMEPFVPDELDEMRILLSDERLYRFILTQIISYVHMWLEYMAFRDEIRFYPGRQQLTGVSLSTVVTRWACSVIILLYLLDGGGTSWVVQVSMLASCVVEGWKVWKLVQPTWKAAFPFVKIRDYPVGSPEQQAADYDRIAIKWMAMILYPLVAAWSLYALRHYEYKSTYSWFISNAANAVYTFGFISLCPQLYVNYRLKSVAHLPWRVFLYKIFNTFIDDVFAFLIEMPWKHRLMTLRDDVVFIMFLCQVYMYRVDKSRTNEFGYAYEEEGDDGSKDVNHIYDQKQSLRSNEVKESTNASGKVKEE